MSFVSSFVCTVTILLTINCNICASQELLYKDLAQRLLLSKDGNFHILNKLLNRFFDVNSRLLTIAVHGQSLPDEVIREAHSRHSSCPLTLIRGDTVKQTNRRLSDTSQHCSDGFVLFVGTFEQVETVLGNVK
jgi:hypothetical protein